MKNILKTNSGIGIGIGLIFGSLAHQFGYLDSFPIFIGMLILVFSIEHKITNKLKNQ
ncbi:hypothetical protein PH210_27795 [Paenibacillus sp. BSR1-1]|uniref:hypothetical protein n=1 Tax=Paenibacillus sp. BSR1-1 TaxID=3020845 RepID=UPI0025B1FD40|nr:hypothetical protein [Paenibacillus sp. BSR1-1]MDN3019949.1 hypothetical protein [Paenibacillus sp. BSR1-1]